MAAPTQNASSGPQPIPAFSENTSGAKNAAGEMSSGFIRQSLPSAEAQFTIYYSYDYSGKSRNGFSGGSRVDAERGKKAAEAARASSRAATGLSLKIRCEFMQDKKTNFKRNDAAKLCWRGF